jgi:hypothetical protein
LDDLKSVRISTGASQEHLWACPGQHQVDSGEKAAGRWTPFGVFLIARSPTLGLLEETTRRPVRVLCLILLLHWDRIAKLCCPSGVVLVGVTDSVLAMLTKWFSSAVAPRNGTGKREAFTDRPGERLSLTAVALPDGIGKVRTPPGLRTTICVWTRRSSPERSPTRPTSRTAPAKSGATQKSPCQPARIPSAG